MACSEPSLFCCVTQRGVGGRPTCSTFCLCMSIVLTVLFVCVCCSTFFFVCVYCFNSFGCVWLFVYVCCCSTLCVCSTLVVSLQNKSLPIQTLAPYPFDSIKLRHSLHRFVTGAALIGDLDRLSVSVQCHCKNAKVCPFKFSRHIPLTQSSCVIAYTDSVQGLSCCDPN